MTLSHIFHFTGNLQLKREAALLTWKKSFREKHGDLNLTSCNIAALSSEQLAAELSTPPFLAEKRLTIVTIGWKIPVKKRKNTLGDSDEEIKIPPGQENYAQSDYWKGVIKNIPENHIVAFVEAEGIPSLSKILDEVAVQKEFSVHSAWEIQNYIQSRLPLISPQGAELLASRIGENLLLLENEIQKLALLPSITDTEITENTIESIDVQNFKLIDIILSGNIKEARGLLQKYIVPLNMAEQVVFSNSFLGAIRKVGIYMNLVANGFPPKSACDLLELKDFVFQKYQRLEIARIQAFAEFYKNLIPVDVYIKTGQLIGDNGLLHHIESCLLKYNSALKRG